MIPSLVDEWRIPTMYISCKDEYPKEYVFNSYESAVAKINELGLSSSLLEYSGKFVYQDHNYGLVVSDVIIPEMSKILDEEGNPKSVYLSKNITDYTDIYVNIPDNNGGYYDLNDSSSYVHYDGRKIISGDTEVKILTYATLNKWYTFFKDYKERFSKYYVNPTYDNAAITYYRMEYEPKSEINEKEFIELSNLFKARGGNDMYQWILQNCMPHDESKMPIDDVSAYTTNTASYTIPILLTTSIDDLGQMSIFSSKWKAGVDYSNNITDSGGTVVDRPYVEDETTHEFSTLNETFMIKDNNSKGYRHNSYAENEFKTDDYINYTDFYVDNNYNEFEANGVIGYSYSPVNGKVIYLYGDSPETEKEVINYHKEDFVLINGEYVKVIYGAYVEPNISDGYVANIDIKKGLKLPVYEDGALRYAVLNGKKFYALKNDDGKYYIYFTDINYHHDNGSKVIQSNHGYILYNNKLYLLNNDSSVLIEDEQGNKTIYYVLNGYFDYKGAKYFISGETNDNQFEGSVFIPKLDVNIFNKKKFITYDLEELDENTLNYLGWDSVKIENDDVIISHKLDIKRADVVTGYSDSKLDLLRRKKVNTDELGNELPGYLDLETSSGGTHYNTPYDQCTLDILYEVGEISNVEYLKQIGNDKLFNGHYLESIKFYYKDRADEFVYVEGDDAREYLRMFFDEPDYDENGDLIETPLYIYIDDERKQIGYKGQFYRPGEIVYCDITYYINATLVYDDYNYKLSEKWHKGVKYVNTSVVTKSVGDFYMSDGSKFTFNYYQLKCEMTSENLDDFKDVQLTNMDYFEMKILKHYYNNPLGEFNWDESGGYWERYNGMVSAPVFRTEYDLWSSTPQNLKSDIYIDRGINAAFEKHLKLEEVHTMDALENYSNGYFKINEY